MVKMYRVAKKAQKELITRAMLGGGGGGGKKGTSLAGMGGGGWLRSRFQGKARAEVAHGGKEARRARRRSKHWR